MSRMSRKDSCLVIFNPAAGRGAAGRLIDAYASRLRERLGAVDSATTERPGDEADLADRALAEGRKALIAVGGDGTWSRVADRIVSSGRRDVALGLLPAGTGNDFAKSLGIRAERLDEVIAGIAEDRRRTIDVGRVGSRHFLNVVGFGFDIAVIDDAAAFPVLRGDALYRFCALRQLFKFRGLAIGVSDGTAPAVRRKHLMFTVSNGNYFGGSFRIAPQASLDDGKLDAVSIYDAGPLKRAALFSRVARGTHHGDPKVATLQAQRFSLSFEPPVRYEIDGEVYTHDGGVLSVEAVPRALDVFVPPA
jgi:diacylglycerol kinase (ATP)